MKSKNGQKYVVNHKPDGYFVTRSCAVLSVIAVLVLMVLVFLVTFFMLSQR